MKKLAVLLQIVGLLAICPAYVALEITHSKNEKSDVNPESVSPKTEIMKTRTSNVPGEQSEAPIIQLRNKKES